MSEAVTLDLVFKAMLIGALGLMWWQLRGWFIRLEKGQETIHQRIDKVDEQHDQCRTDTVQRLARLETRMDNVETGSVK